jgi:hypothetical protein
MNVVMGGHVPGWALHVFCLDGGDKPGPDGTEKCAS